MSTHNSPTSFLSLPFHSHHLSNPPNTICCQHVIPPLPYLPFPSLHLSNPTNTICCQHTIPPLLSPPFPSHNLSNTPNTICCQPTIPSLLSLHFPSLPTIYPILLTQSAVNTQFPHSFPFLSFSSHYPILLTISAVNTQFPHSFPFPFQPLSNPPNTICSQNTIPPLLSLPFPPFIHSP